ARARQNTTESASAVLDDVKAAAAYAAATTTLYRDPNGELMTTLKGNPGFGGVSIDQTRKVLTIRHAKLAEAPPDLVTAGNFAKERGLDLELVEVDHSLDELEELHGELATNSDWQRLASAVMSEWYVDIKRNIVAVGVTQLTPALEATARSLFGDRVR